MGFYGGPFFGFPGRYPFFGFPGFFRRPFFGFPWGGFPLKRDEKALSSRRIIGIGPYFFINHSD